VKICLYVLIGFLFTSSFFFSTSLGFQEKQREFRGRDDLFSVNFPTENHGWACGRWGTVLHTSDGGKSWSRQETGTDYTLSSVSFVDSKNGWIVGDEGTIIHTSDGGKTWKKQKSPVPFFLMAVQFVTPLKGWIVTERTHILATEDGGQTWKVQFSEDDFILKAVSFCDAENGWAVGEYGFVYNTKDGGKNWKKQSGFFRISEETGAVEGGDMLFGVMALNPRTAWAVGIDGYVSRTVDGGSTWTAVNIGAGKSPLFCVTGDKTGSVVVGGKRVFLFSGDNGIKWTKPSLEPSFPYGWIYGAARRGESGFSAVGQQGAIYLNDVQSRGTWRRAQY
jgi:photosystem II stability/assembly factor-like uncharacterized protein